MNRSAFFSHDRIGDHCHAFHSRMAATGCAGCIRYDPFPRHLVDPHVSSGGTCHRDHQPGPGVHLGPAAVGESSDPGRDGSPGWASSWAALAYLADANFRARMAGSILQALPDPISNALPDALRSASGIQLLDFAILDAIGIATMVVAGWLAWPRSRPRRVSSAS